MEVIRILRRSPATAVAAILTLSLTLGAGAAVFAVVDAVLLTPPAFGDPETLFTLGEVPTDAASRTPRAVAYATFEAWRDRAPALASVEAFDGTNLTLTGLGAAERVSATNVTPGFLGLLGVAPAIGRGFAADDVGRPVVVVSNRFWRGRLAADPNAIGRQLVLGGTPHTIVGILPERFFFALSTGDLWRPFPVTPAQAVRAGYRVGVVARLPRNLSAADLERSLDDVSRASMPPAVVVATRLRTAITRDARKLLEMLGGAAALAVMFAFINLSALLLVRSFDRGRELAIRTALGARQREIVRQLVLEAAVLVGVGSACGVWLAVWITPVVGRFALEEFGAIANREIAVSWRVVSLLSATALTSGLICGAAPALIAARRNVVQVLRRGASPPPREVALRRAFVAGEIAVAFVALVSVTLVGRSLLTLVHANPGFDPGGLLTMQVAVPSAGYPAAERVVSFYSTLQAALEDRIGRHSVSIVDELPLTGLKASTVVSSGSASVDAALRSAAADYFSVMRIPLLAGRAFESIDDSNAPPRVVVSRALAQRLFLNEPAVGRRIRIAANAGEAEVIGVVGDVRHRALDEEPAPTAYLCARQFPSHSSVVVVRTERPEADVLAAVREEVARLDRDLPVYGVRPMHDVVNRSPGVPARRVLASAFAGLSLLALVLGGVGLFGMAAHDVAARRPELAVRIALGADPQRVAAGVLGQGAAVIMGGLAAGTVLTYWAARALGSTIPDATVDAVNIGVPATFLIAAGIAALLPAAWRAARTDPLITLRGE